MRRITAAVLILVLSVSVGSGVLAQQDPKPAKRVAKPALFDEVFRPLIGMKCSTSHVGNGNLHLDFKPGDGVKWKLDMIGKDFVRLSLGGEKVYYPLRCICSIQTR